MRPLAVAVSFAACLPIGAAMPQDQSQADWPAALASLARDDARGGSFGPVGPRLWITRAEAAPGLRGDAHWLHHGTLAAAGGRLLVVTLQDQDGVPLRLHASTQRWAPDHATLRYAVGPSPLVDEARWIAPDADVFVSRLTLHGPARVRLAVDSALAEGVAGDPQRFMPTRLDLATAIDPELDARLRRGGADDAVWLEAERTVEQHGSEGRDRKAGASCGELLGREWGGDARDFATWRVAGTGAGDWVLWLRCARAAAGEAEFELVLPDREPIAIRVPSTGGWGETGDQFRLVSIELGALPAGVFALRLAALRDGSNVNLDALLLAPRGLADVGALVQDFVSGRRAAGDPLRGAVALVPGPQTRRGVPLSIASGPRGAAVAVESGSEGLPIAGEGERVHVLALPWREGAELRLGAQRRRLAPPGTHVGGELVSCAVAAEERLVLHAEGAFIAAITRERAAPRDALIRQGRITAHGVSSPIGVTLRGACEDELIELAAGETRVVYAALEFAGTRPLGTATRAALAPADPLAAHRAASAAWFADHAPRFHCGDELWNRLWVYRCFVMRHNLAVPGAGFLPGPVFFEGRHGSWYPQVISFSAPHIVAETRWLADPRYWRANVEAHAAAQQDDGVYPNLLVDRRAFRYANWLPAAARDALAVHPDRALAARLLPVFVRDVRGNAATFDPDGDGLLDPRDHYTTGMEFQPSFWFHAGYDDSRPATDLERVDFTTYQAANAAATAALARELGETALADELEALARRARDALLAKCWHAEDGFFYSLRSRDDDPARCREVIGFYPFRFGLVPDEPRYDAALRTLTDVDEFWTPFPVASAARSVPVFTPHVQRWPGPGGVVTPCMWNGPTWPHANSLVADAMEQVLRTRRAPPFRAADLGRLLDRFARFHAEDGDAGKLLIREYGDGESGVNWGCADYFHSTWCDLLIRQLGGLVPRHDAVLELRPLPLFPPEDPRASFRFDDVPYHGRRLGIEVVRGRELIVRIDGALVARGDARLGLVLDGALERR
jgi:hypothetical protein